MQETLNYIKVLGWGYGGFCSSFGNIAPLFLSKDFDSSLEQIEKRLAVVDGLNYNALFVEATSANGKANLEKYRSVEDSIEYSLHFVRDRKDLLEMLQPDYLIEKDRWQINPKRMFRWAFDAIEKFKADGIWTWEQYQECRGALNELERGFQLRLKEFCTAYDYQLSDDPNSPEPQQAQPKQETTASTIPTINDTDKEKLVFGNALQKQYMSLNNGSYKWTLTKSLLAYMCGRLYCGDRIKEDNSDYSQKYIKGNTQMPAQEVKALFGVDVASNRYVLEKPPRNSWKVDELFKCNGASK